MNGKRMADLEIEKAISRISGELVDLEREIELAEDPERRYELSSRKMKLENAIEELRTRMSC